MLFAQNSPHGLLINLVEPVSTGKNAWIRGNLDKAAKYPLRGLIDLFRLIKAFSSKNKLERAPS